MVMRLDEQPSQHKSPSYYNPGVNSGFKSSISPAGRVGQSSGGEQAMGVGTVHRSVMVDTTTGSAGPRTVGETHNADDK